MAGSASFTNFADHGTDASNFASASTGFSIGRPSASPTSRSISPNAGARCTIPLPSSTVTNSAATTRLADSSSGRYVKGRSYWAPTRSVTGTVPTISAPSPNTAWTRDAASTTSRPPSGVRTRTYSTPGPTAAATLLGNVHCVVVHTSRSTSRSRRDRKSTRLNYSHGYISYAV